MTNTFLRTRRVRVWRNNGYPDFPLNFQKGLA